MSIPLRLLIVEDSEDDALLLGGGRRRFGGAGFAVALVPGMAAEQA